MTQTVLHIQTSARRQDSVTREFTAAAIAALGDTQVINRDLAETPIPQISEDWVTANFTPADSRTEAQLETLAQSDTLVAELMRADTVVIGLPVYNFGMPAALKAWVDHIARAGVTFRYTENGPLGLLSGKKAIVVVASGGVPVDSPVDFATPHLRQVLRFIGIEDITVITADQMNVQPETSLNIARTQLANLSTAA